MSFKTRNFSAGPGVLPQDVLIQIQSEMLNFRDSGCSLLELSHRSSQFEKVLSQTESDIRNLLSIPANYSVLFMQGGATLQFSCVPFNLGRSKDCTAHYIVTGEWTRKALQEANRLGLQTVSHDAENSIVVPETASYILYCSNETIDGVKCRPTLINPHNIPVVCDMSSDIFTQNINVSDFGLIFAGAQKNMGCSGVTMVIVRDDLLLNGKFDSAVTPVMMDYAIMKKHKSMYNTPSTFSIYVCGLVMAYYIKLGGLNVLEAACDFKSKMFYKVLDASCGFYCAVVVKEESRSRVNIVFRIKKDFIVSETMESKFIQEAENESMIQLKGHRSVGGVRASFYNACSMEDVEYLIDFMHRFQKNNENKSS